MKNFYIFDSSADYDSNYDLGVPHDSLKLRVYVDGSEYRDKVDISDEEFYRACLSGAKVGTSQPSLNEMTEKLIAYSKQYEQVYVVTISSKLSGTYDGVRTIVREKNLRNVEVLDSKSGSVKTTYVLMRVINDAENGKKVTQDDVDVYVSESLLLFTVGTLEYLEKGGRIGKAKAVLGKLLKIKPILSTDDEGETVSLGIARTLDGCVVSMRKMAEEFADKLGDCVAIGGYGVGSTKVYLDKLLEGYNTLMVARIGPAIAAHVGPEVFGFVLGRRF